MVNGRTALEITKLKIGPDGHLGSSPIAAQLAPLVRSSQFHAMDRSGFRVFEGEVVALRHIASTLDLPHALKRNAELMTGVREFGLDLLGMIEQDGVENACASQTLHAAFCSRHLFCCATVLLPLVYTDAVCVCVSSVCA
eukprot:COSAG02_NODE_12368_length_1557_cov_1.279835_1_plen_140_part_10